MLTEGDIKNMHKYVIGMFKSREWRRGICIRLENILKEEEEHVLTHIRNQGSISNVEQTINSIWDPMIQHLKLIENDPREYAKVLQLEKDFWWKEIGSKIGKRIGNVRDGTARAPQPPHVKRNTHIAERAPNKIISPAGHWSIQEAEHGGHWSIQEAERGLGMAQKRISELREELTQNPSVDDYLTNRLLERAMIEEYGIQTEIKIHSNHDKIQKDHEVKINRINHTFSGASRFDMIAAAKHKLALVVAEGEKRKHISNLLNKKNYFQHEAAEFMYKPKTDIHGLFDKKTF